VEGLLESMLYEVDTYNIKATLVEPGHLRLDEPDSETLGIKKFSAFRVKRPSEPYSGPHAPAAHTQRMMRWLMDRQPTSTVRSAELSWQLAHCSYPPLRLLLGNYAVESVRDRLRCIIEEVGSFMLVQYNIELMLVKIEDWKHLNFPVDDDGDRTGSRAGRSGADDSMDMEG
jgi:hypothetical protein